MMSCGPCAPAWGNRPAGTGVTFSELPSPTGNLG